jgi:hypothetical protein
MRLEVTIPDQVYRQAQLMAVETGITIDRLVSDAVTMHLEVDSEPPLKLSAEQIAKVRQSQAEIKAGNGRTMAQVEESLAERRAAWLQANPS